MSNERDLNAPMTVGELLTLLDIKGYDENWIIKTEGCDCTEAAIGIDIDKVSGEIIIARMSPQFPAKDLRLTAVKNKLAGISDATLQAVLDSRKNERLNPREFTNPADTDYEEIARFEDEREDGLQEF